MLAAGKRVFRRIVGAPPISLRENVRAPPGGVMRPTANVGQRQVSEQRQGERAGDRRRRQIERIGRGAFREQLSPLVHAEPLLLVDDRQREVARDDIVLEQGVRADENVEIARGEALQGRNPIRTRSRSRQERA